MADKKSDSKKNVNKNKKLNSKKNSKYHNKKQSKKPQTKNQPKNKFNKRNPRRHVRINKKIEGRTGIVYIGNEDSFIYFPDILSFLSRDNIDSVILKSRGRAINVAVDVAEQIRNKFSSEVPELESNSNVEIGTEQVNSNNKNRRVSFINIELVKKVEPKPEQEPKEEDIQEETKTETEPVEGPEPESTPVLKELSDLQGVQNDYK